MFCESTGDINYFLSSKEASELRRSTGFTPIIETEDKEMVFHLLNSVVTKYMEIIEPRDSSFPHYYTKLSDYAYEELIRDKRCGTRYGNSSKVNAIIDDELAAA